MMALGLLVAAATLIAANQDSVGELLSGLLSATVIPGLPVEQMFKRVRLAVAQETRQAQIPWESSSLTGDFCFKRGPDGACPAVAALSISEP